MCNRYGFNGKEHDGSTEWGNTSYDYGFRIYDADIGRFLSVDPLTAKYPGWSPYIAMGNNPVNFIDQDGEEPIKPLAGTIMTFLNTFNNTPSKIGQTTGAEAGKALLRLSDTEMSWEQMRPLPVTTPYFNTKPGRYLYTEKGGWIDMTHFLFYAGRAYKAKMQKEAAQKQMQDPAFSKFPLDAQILIMKRASMDPESEAIKQGYNQERFDPKHSRYSYEDLPSDRFGADFAINFFDPNSKQTLGEQILTYFNQKLKVSSPDCAPNWATMPLEDSKNPPSRTNETTTPVYTSDKP